LRDLLRSRVTDNERHQLEGWEDALQEGQFNFQSVLGFVRSVGLRDKFETAYLAAGFGVHEHTADGSLEGIDPWSSNPTQMNIVCGPDQHDTPNCLCVCSKLLKCCAGHSAGIGVACVRRNQRLRYNV
jgi:hypothetical protein